MNEGTKEGRQKEVRMEGASEGSEEVEWKVCENHLGGTISSWCMEVLLS